MSIKSKTMVSVHPQIVVIRPACFQEIHIVVIANLL